MESPEPPEVLEFPELWFVEKKNSLEILVATESRASENCATVILVFLSSLNDQNSGGIFRP